MTAASRRAGPDAVRRELRAHANPRRAETMQRFFKTGPGEYGEGDLFIGVAVPPIRKLAARFEKLEQKNVERHLRSPVHEERLFALLVMVRRYRTGPETERERIFRLYLRNTKWINSWDLVDVSAGHIVGAHLHGRDPSLLYRLARSPSLWERRIAVMSTFHFIREGFFTDTLALAKLLLADEEDLIHKAVGWMLREVGKRSRPSLEGFLGMHAPEMPRTMLRYAIERLPEPVRRRYLKGSGEKPRRGRAKRGRGSRPQSVSGRG